MSHKEGEFYLIKDQNYKAKKYIGEILKKLENDFYLLNIYIFPEDTYFGRLPHNSYYEVFLTSDLFLYKFDTETEKVEVISLEEYINRKYVNNEKLQYPLYFKRQSYSRQNNVFDPKKLSSVCYCQQIFNPDNPFNLCVCGNIFHLDCLMQNESGKCWFENCDYDCNSFLNEAQKIKKSKILTGGLVNDTYDNQINLLNKKKKEKKMKMIKKI